MTRPLHVYVAGSSDEMDRAVRWMTALTDAGIVVTSTWAANIAAVGAANPRDASVEDRASWSRTCRSQIDDCHVLWLLVPAVGHGRGAYLELGHALAIGRYTYSSGDTKQSIFASLTVEHTADDDAFAAIVKLSTWLDNATLNR